MHDIIDATQCYASVAWEPDDIIEIRPLKPNQGERVWIHAKDITSHVSRMIEENKRGANLYAGILPRNKFGYYDTEKPNKKGGKGAWVGGGIEDVDGGRVLWLDMDAIEAENALEISGRIGMPIPSMAVATGHGAHLFWRLSEWTGKDTIHSTLKRMLRYLKQRPESAAHIDESTKDPARILRLPGFINHKEGKPDTLARLVFADPGLVYDIAAFDPFLDDISIDSPRQSLIVLPTVEGDSTTIMRVRKYLETIPGSSAGGRTNAAFKAAASIVRDFALGDDDAFSLVSEWDRVANNPPIQDDPQYGPDEIRKIVANARKYGKHGAGELISPQPADNFDTDAFIERTTKPAEAKEPRLRVLPSFDPIIEKLFATPGFCAEYMSYCQTYASRYQPIGAIGGLLTLGATLVARRIMSSIGAMSNLYGVIIMVSSGGKDFHRTLNSDVLNHSGMGIYHAETIKTSAGLTSMLYLHPVLLAQIDEMGKKMQMAKASNGGTVSSNFELNSMYLELYNASRSYYVVPIIAGDLRETKRAKMHNEKFDMPVLTIDKPHLIIHGVSTPKTFYEKITTESIEDGLLGRMLILDTDGHFTKRTPPKEIPLPQTLIEEAKWWSSFNAEHGWFDSMAVQPVKVPLTDAANKIVTDFIDIEFEEMKALGDSPLASLWGRVGQIADKIALIYAALRDKNNLIIDGEACKFGYDLATTAVKRTVTIVSESVAENPFDELRLRMLRIIRSNGGRMEHWRLLKKFKRDALDFQRVMSVLIDTGEVKIDSEDTKGRPSSWYTLVDSS